MGTVSNFYSDPNLASIPILFSSRTINPGIDFTNLMRPFKHPKPLPLQPGLLRRLRSTLAPTEPEDRHRIVPLENLPDHLDQPSNRSRLFPCDSNRFSSFLIGRRRKQHRNAAIRRTHRVSPNLSKLLCHSFAWATLPFSSGAELLLASPVRARTNHSCPINPANEVQPI